MAVWEFRLVTDDATILDQTIVAEGQDETQAAASAKTLIEEKSSVALFRPGLSVSLDIAARWQELEVAGAADVPHEGWPVDPRGSGNSHRWPINPARRVG